MTKASALFVLVFFAALITQVNAQVGPHYHGDYDHGQSNYPSPSQTQIITQAVNQYMQAGEIRPVAEMLRLSMSESRNLAVNALTLTASSRWSAQLEVLSRGRPVSQPQLIQGRQVQVAIPLPPGTNMEDLELRVQSEVLIDSVSAQVQSSYSQGQPPLPSRMQPMSGQMIRLDVRQDIRYSGVIDLKRLVEEQLALTLEGAQIERIAVQGMLTRGMGASVQLLINNQIAGPVKSITVSQGITPILVTNFQEVASSLSLQVQGDVMISQVHIRLGQVRQIQRPQPSYPQRIQVSQQISATRPLALSTLLPYESRLVSSLSIEARPLQSAQAEIALIAMGQLLTSTIITQVPMRPVLQLMRPASLRDLSLQSLSPVMIDSLEITFSAPSMW